MNHAVAMGYPEPIPGDSVLRILVVDDDRGEFPLLEASFAASGAEVELATATTGHLAIVSLFTASDDQQPHLALVDIGMPLISGFDLARQLVEKGIPTVMMSALVTPERREQAHAIGALDLLAKPQDATGYTDMVRRVIELARKHGSAK